MSKPKKVWLAREKFHDGDEFYGDYILFKTKPHKRQSDDKTSFVSPDGRCDPIDLFCQEEFEAVTGFTLKLGECKRVTIEIKPV